MSAFDRQEGGSHYRLPIQPVTYILTNGLGFVEGCVVKYVTRWRVKGGVLDLKKARHYLDMLIEHAEAQAAADNPPSAPASVAAPAPAGSPPAEPERRKAAQAEATRRLHRAGLGSSRAPKPRGTGST